MPQMHLQRERGLVCSACSVNRCRRKEAGTPPTWSFPVWPLDSERQEGGSWGPALLRRQRSLGGTPTLPLWDVSTARSSSLRTLECLSERGSELHSLASLPPSRTAENKTHGGPLSNWESLRPPKSPLFPRQAPKSLDIPPMIRLLSASPSSLSVRDLELQGVPQGWNSWYCWWHSLQVWVLGWGGDL